MTPIIFPLPGNEKLVRALTETLGFERGTSEIRRFPDNDSYVRLDTPVAGRDVIFVCTLDRADDKFLPLCFASLTARELGASRVGLICPYLAYMRQDKRFRPGEAISSNYFAKLLSENFDWLITVDPHLHRHHSLAEIFSIPATTAHAAPFLASWIRENVREPILIGPDRESEQWVASVASDAKAPYVVLDKIRKADREVEIFAPQIAKFGGRTPVLVDDIISTGGTMIQTMQRLAAMDYRSPFCMGVHAIFADDAYKALREAGAANIVTCNTIPHESNAIDLAVPIAASVRRTLGRVT